MSAIGGSGLGHWGGGSGGAIVLDGDFRMNEHKVDASGGVSDYTTGKDDYNGCANGGAGSIWNRKTDELIIDNKDKPTDKYTRITAPRSSHIKGKHYREIADTITIKGRGNGAILGKYKWMVFNNLKLEGKVRLSMDRARKNFTIKLQKNIHMAPESTFDLSKCTGVILNVTDTANLPVQLGGIMYRHVLGIKGKQVALAGKIMLPERASKKYRDNASILISIDKHIELKSTADLQGGNILLQSNGTISSAPGANVNSYIENSCNTDPGNSELFTCVPHKTLSTNFTAESFIEQYDKQYRYIKLSKGYQHHPHTLDDVVRYIFKNFTVYMVSFEEINLSGTNMTASRVGMCAPNIKMTDSNIDVSARGCTSHKGLGQGIRGGICSGTGGSHGGNGGYGGLGEFNGDKATRKSKMRRNQCHLHFPKPYYFGKEARYEGSGGGSGKNGKHNGGKGGGIAWLSTPGILELNQSNILSEGGDGTCDEKDKKMKGAGGGAGGSVQIITGGIKGDGLISINGGNGSVRGGGGGAGGRMVVNLLHSFMASSYPAMSHDYTGKITVAGGMGGAILGNATEKFVPIPAGNGQDGVIYHDKCFGGYTGPFCKACDVGEFKLGFSFGVCKTCENKPTASYYTSRGVGISNCPYECSAGLDPFEVNPYCENALNAQITRVGGSTNSLLVIAGFMLLLILIWISLIARSNAIMEATGKAHSKVYDGVLFTTGAEKDNKEKAISKKNMCMQDSDIWSHSHRMYLIGENSINFPWYIPKDFPNRALDSENREKFLRFVKTRQLVLDWSDLQKEFYYVMRVLFPPAANWLHKRYRYSHFNTLRDSLYDNFDREFWSGENKTMRVSMGSNDCHLAYIDFLDKTKSKIDFNGNKLPVTLMLSGCGTFNSPYSLEFENDPYAKALVYLNEETMKPDLPIFFNNMNTLLSKLSFYKLNRQTMKDLFDVIDWVEVGNRTLFNPEKVRATLYLFENTYQEVQGGSFKQKRRSLPLEGLVFDAFPDMYKNLIKLIQSKLIVKKSEIKLALVFRPLTSQKNQRMKDRIKKIIQTQMQVNKALGKATAATANIGQLYVSDDEDEDDDVNQGLSPNKMNLGSIKDSNAPEDEENKQVNLSEHLMEDQEVYVHGGPKFHTEYVKIIDKSRRAYSFSLDSTKAFEMSLKKPRNGCGDRCTRTRAIFYAFWLLIFKHHGRAPGKDGLYAIFFCFSLCVALDLVLVCSMINHLTGPMSNIQTIGIPFLCIYPLIAVLAPIYGAIGCITGSADALRTYSMMNSTCVLINYPATVGLMLYLNHEPIYICIVAILWLIKMPLSFFGSKVRQHLENPAYIENEKKFRELAERTADSIRFPKNRTVDLDASPVKAGSAFASEQENNDEFENNAVVNQIVEDKADGGEDLVNLMPTSEDTNQLIAPETEADAPLINVGL